MSEKKIFVEFLSNKIENRKTAIEASTIRAIEEGPKNKIRIETTYTYYDVEEPFNEVLSKIINASSNIELGGSNA
ncbi:MAG: hypothetical protein BWY78_00300 [Alphaproteobacteria bacterium ADurb.Bin438]|nr:MAG: hypothetical protein BWY78_00300 [Alphaproteobacteria bacterium ADurb.Bin438]